MRSVGKLKRVPTVNSSTDFEPGFDPIELSTERLPLISEGTDYEVIVIGCRRTHSFGRWVLTFTFRIVSQCEFFDWIIPTTVNCPTQGRHVPKRSKLASWLRLIQSFDQANIGVFAKYQFKATVTTVTMDYDRRPLPKQELYSKIADLTEVIGRLKS
jgi:hypothetical protein